MEKGKHSRARRRKKTSIFSNLFSGIKKKEDIDISSSTNPKLLLATRIVAAFSLLVMAAGLTYVSFLHLLPLKFLIILAVLILLITAGYIVLIETKTQKIVLKVSCIVLSVIVSVVTIYGGILLGTFHTSISEMPEDPDAVVTEKANVTKEPFMVYISGLDTRNQNQIKEKGLSDVNMVVAVNPNTKKVLMINIPRDYYVPLDGDSNKMDKLTHAGNYGIGCSMKTLESLFDIKFNYYFKVNFKSVVDIVDSLGGITVTSDFNFSSTFSLSGKSYTFKKGENNISGDAALAFARERKKFSKGDRQRGIHQQKVITGIINKLISPSMLNPAKINKVLSSVTSNTKTNVSSSQISSLVQMQLNDMASWDIQSFSVDGTGSSRPSYAAGGQKLSVMIPNSETVEEAKAKIAQVIGK